LDDSEGLRKKGDFALRPFGKIHMVFTMLFSQRFDRGDVVTEVFSQLVEFSSLANTIKDHNKTVKQTGTG